MTTKLLPGTAGNFNKERTKASIKVAELPVFDFTCLKSVKLSPPHTLLSDRELLLVYRPTGVAN